MRRLPKLDAGATYAVAIRNLARLLRYGLSLSEAADIVLRHAGLSRFPRRPVERPATDTRPTIH
jgi:hypothetical protein